MDLTLVTGNANLESYDILSFIGDGSFGTVHIVADKTRSTPRRAMKMIDKVRLCKLHSLDRVLKEVSIHRSLNHPNVVQLYQFFENENYLYMIMDLCDHGDLDRLLKKNSIPAKFNVFVCLLEIIQGLEYIHRFGIIHRDLKPGNLLVTSEYTIKLADFGSAVYESELREMKRIPRCGTPSYMAPEAVSELPYGRGVDIWSLGCVFYVVLVGRTPFAGASKEVFQKICAVDYTIPDHLPREAKDLICSILQKNPQNRPGLNQIRQHEFFSLEVFPSDIYVSMSCMNLSVLADRRSVHVQRGSEDRQGSLKRQNSVRQLQPSGTGSLASLSYEKTKLAPGDALIFSHGRDGRLDNQSKNSPGSDLCRSESGQLPAVVSSDDRLSTQQHQLMQEHSITSSLHRSRSCSVTDHLEQASRRVEQPSHVRHRSSSSKPLAGGGTSKGHSSQAENNVSYDSGFINSVSEISSCQGFVSNSLADTRGRVKGMSASNGHDPSRKTARRSNSVAADNRQNVQHRTTDVSCSSQGLLFESAQSITKNPAGSRGQCNDERKNAAAGRKIQSKSRTHGRLEKPLPIDVSRVRMGRHCMKTIVCTIMDGHWLVVEILKASKQDSKVVEEVLHISPDGMQIEYFLPNSGSGYVLKDSPVDLQKTEENGYKTFDYERLPENLWKKYSFAAVFAKIVRTMTPIVTYHSCEDQAKAVLMDNMPDPDFELRFYDGTTFVQRNKTVAKIILKDGKTLPPTAGGIVILVPDYSRKMKSLSKLYKKCMDIEKNICQLEKTLSTKMFPVIIGQKEARPPDGRSCAISDVDSGVGSDHTTSTTQSIVRNCQDNSSVKSNELRHGRSLQKIEANSSNGQTCSAESQCSGGSRYIAKSGSAHHDDKFSHTKHREASMPSIKSYLKLADDGLLVKFSDRSELVLHKVTGEVVYTDSSGVENIYPSGSKMPYGIYQKINTPELQQLLSRHHSATSMSSSSGI